MSLTLVSLFDGIGGFPLAFERAGVKIVAAVEIDKAAAAVSAKHFPEAVQFDDVCEVTGDQLRATGFVGERGIITAGFPCQDLSVAGRRAGLAGARSGLWWEVVRLLDETRPRWFLGENVPGLLSSNGGRDFGAVLGSLGELGYGFAYRVLDAQYFGVPQQRRRVFIVGHLGVPFGAAAQVLLEPEGSSGDSAARRKAWPDVASTLMAGTNRTGGTRPPGTQVDTVGTIVVASGVGEAGRDVTPTVTARYGKGAESDADDALLLDGIEHTHTAGPVSTLQGGGKRGYRIDAESAAGGHLIVQGRCAR